MPEPHEVIVTLAMIAAGVEAMAFAGSTDAEMALLSHSCL